MKNIKRFALVAMLVGSVAVLLSSCAMKLNTEQQALYDAMIASTELAASMAEIPADTVKTQLEAMNVGFKVKGFKVVDRKAGKPIAKGTKAAQLKKRFIPKKA